MSPSDLVAAVADVVNLRPEAVDNLNRALTLGGLRRRGGRGRSAPTMGPEDAVALTVAALAGVQAKEVASTCRQLLALRSGRGEVWMMAEGVWHRTEHDRWSAPLPALEQLGDDHTFGDALQALLISAADGSLETFTAPYRAAAGRRWIEDEWLDINVTGPVPRAMIEVSLPNVRASMSYGADPPTDALAFRAWVRRQGEMARGRGPDRTARIGATAVLDLGRRFARREPDTGG